MSFEKYATKKTLYHVLTALPAFIVLVVFGTSLNHQWWFYTVLFILCLCSLALSIACIFLAPRPECATAYAIVSMLSFLFFIPAFCCLVLTIFFGILLLFGVNFNP